MASYPFLSAEWIEAARALRDEYADQLPPAPAEARVNVVVTEVPHGSDDEVRGHIDTSSGQTIIEWGHIEDPELTVTLDYLTARAAFVTRDQQEVMQAFLTGKILVDGDATKLLALQATAPPSEVETLAVELYQRLEALTADES